MDFYEDDEPIEDIRSAFASGERGMTQPESPVRWLRIIATGSRTTTQTIVWPMPESVC